MLKKSMWAYNAIDTSLFELQLNANFTCSKTVATFKSLQRYLLRELRTRCKEVHNAASDQQFMEGDYEKKRNVNEDDN